MLSPSSHGPAGGVSSGGAGIRQYMENPPSYRRASRWTARDRALAPSSARRAGLSRPVPQGRDRGSRSSRTALPARPGDPGEAFPGTPRFMEDALSWGLSLPPGFSPDSGGPPGPKRGISPAARFSPGALPAYAPPAAASVSSGGPAAVSQGPFSGSRPPEGSWGSAAPVPPRRSARVSSGALCLGLSGACVSALRPSQDRPSPFKNPSQASPGAGKPPDPPPRAVRPASRSISQAPGPPTGGIPVSPRPPAYRPASLEPPSPAFPRPAGLRRPSSAAPPPWRGAPPSFALPPPSRARSAAPCRSSSQPK